MRLTASPG